MEELWRVIQSMRRAADEAGVSLVTGDTEVVDRGKGDRIFVNTSGVGIVREEVDILPGRAAAGDRIIVGGQIAVHGIAIMSVREGLEFETEIASDTAPLNGLVEAILEAGPGGDVHVLRDPTRGGVTSVLSEIAETAQVGIRIDEARIPISKEVKGACAILGLDPLCVANEGIAVVAGEAAEAILAAMRAHRLGRDAAIIGEVVADHPGMMTMKTRVGGTRVADMLSGKQLPRIC